MLIPLNPVSRCTLNLRRQRRAAWGWMAAVVFLLATIGVAAAQGVNDGQLRRTDGRSVICSRDQDLLDRVRCRGSLRVGVRGNYPGFGVRNEATFTGYDVSVAKLIGEELGVAVELVEVTSLNRIAKLGSGSVDMVIATMAHTTTRQREIRFVRPHYYAAYTAVVGEKTSALRGEYDLAGRSVCTPLGHFSNLRLTELRARVSLYDNSTRMMDALMSGVCSMVLHDATFFLAETRGVAFARRFEEKVRFDSAPWGIGIAHGATDGLYWVVSKIIAEALRTGRLTELAATSGVPTAFLSEQEANWSMPECWNEGAPSELCFLTPYEDEFIR